MFNPSFPPCLSLFFPCLPSLPSFPRPFPSPRPHIPSPDPWPVKGSPMQGLTTLSSVVVWTLFFFASRIHECAATPSQNYLPQVTYPPLCPFFASLRLIFFFPPDNTLQGFYFDWNPPGTTVPIPVTRTIRFFFGGGVVISFVDRRTTEQCDTLSITWERGSTGVGWA